MSLLFRKTIAVYTLFCILFHICYANVLFRQVSNSQAPSIHQLTDESIKSAFRNLFIDYPKDSPTRSVAPQASQLSIVHTETPSPWQEQRLPQCYHSDVPMTYYWIAREDSWDETEDGHRVYLSSYADAPRVPLYSADNKILAMVSAEMYSKCKLEGTCLLQNGDLINLAEKDGAFEKIGQQGRKQNLFGWGSGKQNLVPFVSVAANDIPLGTILYIPQLDGASIGQNQRHNGCVRVDDTSNSFDDCQLDWFVVSFVDSLAIEVDDDVSPQIAPSCVLKNYVTQDHLAYVKADTSLSTVQQAVNDTLVRI